MENLTILYSQITQYKQAKIAVASPFSPGTDRLARGIPSVGPIRDSFSQGLAPYSATN
jgi:hypothetical protein